MLLSELAAQLQNLVGHRVEAKTIAGNSIWLWFEKEKTFGFYIEPPWRVLSDAGIVGTSADFPWERNEDESESQYRIRFENACANTDGLQGSILTRISVDEKTSDIQLVFDSGLELSSFTVWREEDNWEFVDQQNKKRFRVSVSGVNVSHINA